MRSPAGVEPPDAGSAAGAQSAEVFCEEMPSRVKDELDELAAWPEASVYDEITGATLPPELARQARAEGVTFMPHWSCLSSYPACVAPQHARRR